MGNKVSLEDEMVNLRIVSKQMQRSAKKCEKNEKAALDKLKKVRSSKDDFAEAKWRSECIVYCVCVCVCRQKLNDDTPCFVLFLFLPLRYLLVGGLENFFQ